MNTFEEKKFTLEMIAFSTVDGQLQNENMIAIIAQELQINKDEFNQFFHEEAPQIPIKTERFSTILQTSIINVL
jgi:hypothetical protein